MNDRGMTRPVYSSTICTLPSATMFTARPVGKKKKMKRREKRLLNQLFSRSTNGPQSLQSHGKFRHSAFAVCRQPYRLPVLPNT